MPILLDWESRSRVDLTVVGGRRYAEHPSTEALCCVLHDTDAAPGTPDELWLPGDPVPASVHGRELGAHNWSGFDRFLTARFFGVDQRDGIDTSILARRAGLPGALDALGARLFGRHKDKAASRFTTALSSARRPKAVSPSEWRTLSPAEKRLRGVQPALTPDALERVARYCADDVEIMAQGWPHLEPFLTGGVFAGWEGDVLRVDRIVNDRGVRLDVDLARALLRNVARNQDRVIDECAAVVGVTPAELRAAAGSPTQFTALTGEADAQAETVAKARDAAEARVVDDSLAFAVRDRAEAVAALCRARQALASIAGGKLLAGLARTSADGIMRDNHRYYGALTGRDSGVGMQLQNFARPSPRFEAWGDAEIRAEADRVLAGGECDAETVDLLLRACITAPSGGELAVCDFSGVEARALAWAAGDAEALRVFREGRLDVYKIAASIIFGVPYDQVTKAQRQVGKVSELSAGYQGGPDALLRMAKAMGIDLAALGVSPLDVVQAWRRLHAPSVRFWRQLDDAFRAAIDGHERDVGPFQFRCATDGTAIAIFLPSGRPIVYNGVGLAKGHDRQGRERLSPYYAGTRNPREHLYGGKICENVIQAMCRDLMMLALVEAERRGLAPVLRVHDEIVCDVPRGAEGYAELRDLMLTLPDWAPGFPVGASGHFGKRYRK